MYVEDCMADWPWALQVLVRVLAAAILAGLVGLERERRGRSAGFRTQMLVGVGAALAMCVGMQFSYWPRGLPAFVRVDPTRIAYGVMGGVGFLGAGTIINRSVGIRGLTTAASLWCTAAIGLAAGTGMLEVAAVATAIVVFILAALRALDHRISQQWTRAFRLTIAKGGSVAIERYKALLTDQGASVADVEYHHRPDQEHPTLTLHAIGGQHPPEALIDAIEAADGVLGVELVASKQV